MEAFPAPAHQPNFHPGSFSWDPVGWYDSASWRLHARRFAHLLADNSAQDDDTHIHAGALQTAKTEEEEREGADGGAR